jgi:DNA repair protein NreA
MDFSCKYCGGSRLQHLRNCPKVYSIIKQKQFNETAKKEYFGESPNVFIGRYGYPKVNVGFLSETQLPKDADSPKIWSEKDYQIPEIVDIRSSLVNSRFKADIKSFDDKFLEITKEISQAKKPVDVEVHLDKKPNYSLNFNQDITPYGPSVNLEKAEITENPSIPKHVDKVVSDTDLKAVGAIDYLYKKGYDEHFLTKLISVGNLGIEKNRKLVPTRWSITAVDDTLGKKLISEIKDFNTYEYAAHFGGYLGNYYLILFFPEIWSYELFENYIGEKNNSKVEETATDYEDYNGRKDYASNTVGGYYAARLSILEYLKKRKKQASVLAIRFIDSSYYMPLGVWVVRQAVRHSLRSKPIIFSDKDLMMKYAKMLTKKKYNLDIDFWIKKSILIKEISQQKKLSSF